jgi:hypothetical protein
MLGGIWKSFVNGTSNDGLDLKPHWPITGEVVDCKMPEGDAESDVGVSPLPDRLKTEMRLMLGMFRTGSSKRFVQIPGCCLDQCKLFHLPC